MSDNDKDDHGSLGNFARRYAVAAGGAFYAFTFGVGDAQNRRLIQDIARRFGHHDGEPPRLPTAEVDGITEATTSVALPEPIASDGNVTLLELLVLARLVRERRPRRVFEIGTFDGRTTLTLAINAADDAQIFTLDLPAQTQTAHAIERAERAFVDKAVSGARFHGTDAARKITQVFGDSATFDFTPFDAELVFVDGSHAYEYVLNDSERALGLLGRHARSSSLARLRRMVWSDTRARPSRRDRSALRRTSLDSGNDAGGARSSRMTWRLSPASHPPNRAMAGHSLTARID